MKKYLALFVVAIMAMSMCVITASADDGFYPVDGGTFNVIGDWDFDEATIAENLTIPEQTDGGTVTYANGGVTFNELEGGVLPAVEFLPSKRTVTPTASDYLYFEFVIDFREADQFGDFRLTLYNSQSPAKDTGFIGISQEGITFRGRNSGGSLLEVGMLDCDVTEFDGLTKIGMLVNLSEKYYAGYVNGEMVCEKTFTDYAMRTGYLTGSVQFTNLVSTAGADNSITFYDYKLYRGVTPDPIYPYSKVLSWDFANNEYSLAGSEGVYSVTNTDGLNVTMTDSGAFPAITLTAKNPGGSQPTDMYYYEFTLNSGSLKPGSSYTITFTGRVTSTYKTFFTINVYNDKLFFKRGNGGWSQEYAIPAELQGTDIKLGLLIDQDDGEKGQTYVYINRKKVTQAGNNDRNKYHPFNQSITITDDATQAKTAGEAIVIKSIETYHCSSTAEPIQGSVIPEEGTFTATASYDVDSIAESNGKVTASVTLTKEGNAGWYNKDIVIVASYTVDGVLLDYEIADAKVKGGETVTISKSVDAEVGGKVKVFLWDDMKTLVPTAAFDVLE